ncbi:hypothetical protein B0B36_17925 [Pseudomonas syringae pv. actinidifoliorum]|uniref:Uncharacterized protein n=2 Tax=Pseudomonas TaxID=286 RepID=A0A2P0QG38_PSESF|nr:hypothetical protein PsaNZ47_24820 [Pseudomonas syringae pv. actinidiae]KTC11547.1 hypothetical protein AO390_09195 [Pseudomonas marginalis ICMP 11289]OOK95244.1 hypothetical protein B0B36_17925 [Pseudomonas syringae pv. actinidifoliorum]ARO45337.1 hypothetical protein [Pseudomonas syringae pv. actinidiae]OKS61078.1 hypothetical protein PsaNZ62_01740 [Pseudomonas syringae pv. actinidiae]
MEALRYADYPIRKGDDMSNIDLLVQKLAAHSSSQQELERRAKDSIVQAEFRLNHFIELVTDTLKAPASQKLLSITSYKHEHDLVVDGSPYKVNLTGLKVSITGKSITLKPFLQSWDGKVRGRLFLEGTKDDSRSITEANDRWELSTQHNSSVEMNPEAIAGLFLELL